MDSIIEIEEGADVESDVEEEPVNSTTVKNVNDALESATNLKAFFETQSFSGSNPCNIANRKLSREEDCHHKPKCETKKSYRFLSA